ncbi:MAG: GtrA family protein [Acidimicrobiia bacterium]|nr:GtrA family protein [Acidimicrobiia bacterium]NNL71023.1 GtrA family protein [Acidimicrobiia bacterium]
MRNYLKTLVHPEAMVQMMKLGFIGGFNTFVSLGLSLLFRRAGMADEPAVALAWIIGTLLSYFMNRRWTFSLATAGANVRETSHFFVVNVVAGTLTVGFVWLAGAVLGELSDVQFLGAQIVASIIIVIPKFAAYRDVVFKRSLTDARDGG